VGAENAALQISITTNSLIFYVLIRESVAKENQGFMDIRRS